MPLRLNVLRGILDQASSERNTEARKRWAQAPFVLITFSTYNVLRNNNTTLQGKNNAVTMHIVSNAKFTNP
jgi:hypothetical protein